MIQNVPTFQQKCSHLFLKVGTKLGTFFNLYQREIKSNNSIVPNVPVVPTFFDTRPFLTRDFAFLA